MLTPEQLSQLDQEAATIIDHFPSFWWGLFKGCTDKGFTREEALELVKTQIRGSFNASCMPHI